MMKQLIVTGLTKTFGQGDNIVHALSDVNLSVEKGEFLAIMGASGSGKTTLLNCISTIDKPTSGEIRFEDFDIIHAKENELADYRAKNISYIFQAYNLLPYLSALDNVIAAMEITKTKQENYRQVALDRLARVGIDEILAKKQVTKLSGGQQQRVAIVRAICCEHQLIVADEPTGNLDETTSQDIVKLFQEIAHEQNRCIIIVTHEIEVAKSCDEVFELKNKKFQKIEV